MRRSHRVAVEACVGEGGDRGAVGEGRLGLISMITQGGAASGRAASTGGGAGLGVPLVLLVAGSGVVYAVFGAGPVSQRRTWLMARRRD